MFNNIKHMIKDILARLLADLLHVLPQSLDDLLLLLLSGLGATNGDTTWFII